jgi:hypothetical protein
MFGATRQDGLYVVGGTITMCRFLSRYTALLIKASLEGVIDNASESKGRSGHGRPGERKHEPRFVTRAQDLPTAVSDR